MAEKVDIDLQSIEIVPLADKKMLKGAFSITDELHQSLINWFRTFAWKSQAEKKSKTFLVYHGGQAVAFIALSTGVLTQNVNGVPNTTNFPPQVLVVGKLYVLPECRSSGIGSKLLNFVVGIASNMNELVGCAGLIVDANSNESTVRFYKRFGFEEIDKNEDGRTVQLFFKLPE